MKKIKTMNSIDKIKNWNQYLIEQRSNGLYGLFSRTKKNKKQYSNR